MFGLIPNLMKELAESPTVLESYLDLNEKISETAFNPVEQQVVFIAASVENSCHFCSAAHSFLLLNQLEADDALVDALKEGTLLPDDKLNTLAETTRAIVRDRGFVDEEILQNFVDRGYTKRHLLDLHLIIATKTISNYFNHIAETPLNDKFEEERVEFDEATV